MLKRLTLRLSGALTAALCLMAVPASAQYTPRTLSDPATGEKFHIEGAIGLWSPDADISISSEGVGIEGSTIDFKNDLGLLDKRFGEFHLTGKLARKHKLRFQFIPIKYQLEPVLIKRELVFNGQKYVVGLPVTAAFKWNAYRFTYEYDFLAHDRWFAGLILEAKYTDVDAELRSPILEEFAHAKAPIPAIGGIGRYYFVPNISITGELSGITLPKSVSEDYNAHYFDLDIYGTVNVTRNFGGQFGYRKFDVAYKVKEDSGALLLRGLYFSAVARF